MRYCPAVVWIKQSYENKNLIKLFREMFYPLKRLFLGRVCTLVFLRKTELLEMI